MYVPSMKYASLIILLLILRYLIPSFVGGPVTELSDSDFDETIVLYENALVLFHVPDEMHEDILSAFDKASRYCSEKSMPVTFVKVLCSTTAKETCDAYGAEQTVLKFFHNGEYEEDYQDIYSAESLIRFIDFRTRKVIKDLHSLSDLRSFVDESDGAVVGFFTHDSDLKSVFQKVASEMRKILPFGMLKLNESLPFMSSSDSIIVFRPSYLNSVFESPNDTYDGPATSENLTFFIKNKYHGLVGHRTSKNSKDFSTPLIVSYFKVDYVKNLKFTNYWRNRILMVAKEFGETVRFAISSADEFERELNEVDIDPKLGNLTIVVIARNSKGEKFIMDNPFSVEKLKNFVKDFMDGKLLPFIRSEPIPQDNDGPVKIAVGKNFAEVVTENGKDTFIKFYAPWCGHCKKLAPVFDKLGEKLKDEDIVIAKMDATVNDVPPSFEVDGYPTLYWIPKNQRDKPEKYDGGRELTDMMEFIASKATDELKGYDRKGRTKHIKTEL